MFAPTADFASAQVARVQIASAQSASADLAGAHRTHQTRMTRRRQFLKASLAAATLPLLPALESISRAADPATASDAMIDAHVHVWTPDVDTYPLAEGYRVEDMLPRSFTPDELLAHARPCGVTRIVLIQMSYYGTDNRYMLDAIRQYPGVFSGVAIVDENDQPAKRMKELRPQGVRGFRLQPRQRKPDDWLAGDGMRQMWRCGADEQLAMCLLIDPEYLPSVERMCARYPETPVVIDHFARIGVDGMIRDGDVDNLCRLASHPQTYVKVSAFYALGKKQPPYRDLIPMIRRVLDAFGANRLMWATDCPYQVQDHHTYAGSLELVQSGLDFLTREQQRAMLHDTAAQVYFSN